MKFISKRAVHLIKKQTIVITETWLNACMSSDLKYKQQTSEYLKIIDTYIAKSPGCGCF